MTAAMRSGDAFRRDVLRMTQSAVYNVEKSNRRALSDEEIVGVLAREVKTRRESIEAFRRGGREDLASKEEREIAIISTYLPEQLGDDEVRALVDEAIATTGATSPRDMGRVMGWLSPRTKGRADGKRVSELVGQALARAGESAQSTPVAQSTSAAQSTPVAQSTAAAEAASAAESTSAPTPNGGKGG